MPDLRRTPRPPLKTSHTEPHGAVVCPRQRFTLQAGLFLRGHPSTRRPRQARPRLARPQPNNHAVLAQSRRNARPRTHPRKLPQLPTERQPRRHLLPILRRIIHRRVGSTAPRAGCSPTPARQTSGPMTQPNQIPALASARAEVSHLIFNRTPICSYCGRVTHFGQSPARIEMFGLYLLNICFDSARRSIRPRRIPARRTYE